MNRRTAIASIPLLAFSCSRSTPTPAGRKRGIATPFLAISLKEAERRLKAGADAASRSQIVSLCDLRHLLGAVRDGATDLVLVGSLLDRGLASDVVGLDTLVAAMRAVIVKGVFPLVSIDRGPDTQHTGKQIVHLEGVSEDRFAKDLVLCDVILKKLALGVIPGPMPSYFEACVGAATRGSWPGNIGSRLWFHAHEASLISRDDVVALRAIRVGVKTQVVSGGSAIRDEQADRYSAELTARLDTLAAQLPDLARLSALFEAVAVAKGLERLAPSLDLSFWLRDYALPSIRVPHEVDLLRRSTQISTAGGQRVLEIEGGIDTRLLAMRLASGDHTAFRDAVLRTRPSVDALSWSVPLDSWRFVGVTTSLPSVTSTVSPGTQLERRLTETPSPPLPDTSSSPASPSSSDPRGGVRADVVIKSADIRRQR